MHKSERRTATTKTVRETEAEVIAFVVSQSTGLNAGHASNMVPRFSEENRKANHAFVDMVTSYGRDPGLLKTRQWVLESAAR